MTKVRKMPVRLETIHLDGDYEGWEFSFRKNPPMGKWIRTLKNIQAQGEESEDRDNLGIIDGMNDVLKITIHSWNFVDEEGKALPCDSDGIEALPEDLVMLVFEKVMESITEAPLVRGSS